MVLVASSNLYAQRQRANHSKCQLYSWKFRWVTSCSENIFHSDFKTRLSFKWDNHKQAIILYHFASLF